MAKNVMKLEIDKSAIRDYFRDRHIYEMKNLSEFTEKILKKGIIEGCIAVKFSDGSMEQYYILPDELDTIINFVQSLSEKRMQYYQERIEEFKD